MKLTTRELKVKKLRVSTRRIVSYLIYSIELPQEKLGQYHGQQINADDSRPDAGA